MDSAGCVCTDTTLAHSSDEAMPLLSSLKGDKPVTFGTSELGTDGDAFMDAEPSAMSSFAELKESPIEHWFPAGGVSSAQLNFITAAVTPSVLSIPLAFVSGFWFCECFMAGCCLMTYASVGILSQAAQVTNNSDYESLCGMLLGNWARVLVRNVLLFYNLGCATVYLRFLYDGLVQLLPKLRPLAAGGSLVVGPHGPLVVLSVIVAVVTPMLFKSRISSLRAKGFVANGLILGIVCVIVYRYFVPFEQISSVAGQQGAVQPYHFHRHKPVPGDWLSWQTFLPYLFAGPILIFSFEVQSNALSIIHDLHPKTNSTIRASLGGAVVFTFALYSVLGYFGSKTFPNSTSGNVLSLYSADDPLIMCCEIACGFAACVSFLFVLFPTRHAVIAFLGASQRDQANRMKVACALSIASLCLAVFVPDVGVAVSLLGALCSSTLSMTLPALLGLKLRTMNLFFLGRCEGAVLVLLLVLGVTFATVGTFISVTYSGSE